MLAKNASVQRQADCAPAREVNLETPQNKARQTPLPLSKALVEPVERLWGKQNTTLYILASTTSVGKMVIKLTVAMPPPAAVHVLISPKENRLTSAQGWPKDGKRGRSRKH